MRALTIFLLLAVALSSLAQETPSSTGDFFSGIVVTCTSQEVVIVRKGLAKDSSVVRTFTIDEKTKVEGTVKPKAHITVRFMPGENETRAVHIIVR